MKSKEAFKNILVINLMHIGDLMIVTPILRTLHHAYPGARLSLLADKKLADLVSCNPHIDECLFIDKKGADDKLPAFIKYIGYVRSKKFDLVINLHRNERASALAAFSGAKRIVGYSKPGFSWFFDKVVDNNHWTQHQVLAHFEALMATDVIEKSDIDDAGLEMVLPPGAEDGASAIWQQVYPAADKLKKVVAFNIGASWPTKRWLPDYFAQVADTLIEEGCHIAFFGGPMDTEMVNECVSFMKHREAEKDENGNPLVARFTGRVSLGELASLLKRCALMITTDSGPMHVGVAMHVPVVTMFGASPVPGFYPYDAKDILIKTPAPCHPCGIHNCPKKGEENFMCMKRIPPEIVLSAAREQLEKYSSMVGNAPYPKGQYTCRVIEL